ncbi:MAG: iron-containing alcohol dehydrogenase, partial [Nitrospinaceae bacterium]|nr:iron-containing alcohol dehydrogenase [Nitrospinaceae bacterium]
TSGTGSEVTKWASIWGDDGAKFSLTHPALFPKNAILDPGLCTSMPRELTLYSALDTLSHAMESIWNVKHTSVSDAFATMAIRMVKGRLIEVLENPGDKKLRSQLQTAALFGGMAMSMTQTAIAHAISYPLTSHLGLPHGFACGFTLPEVARFIGERHPQRISLIAEAFGCRNDDLTKNMVLWFRSLGVADSIQRFALPEDIENLDCSFINPSRSNNTLRAVDNEIARRIAVRALEQLLEED